MNMREEFILYLERLIHHIPNYVFIGLLLTFFLGVVWVVLRKKDERWHFISQFALAEYIVFLFSSTVIFRDVKEVRRLKFIPFWSYGQPDMLVQIMMNVVVFVPIGFLLGFANNRLMWWHVLLIGAAISMSIELLQLVFKRGFFELDDMIHNVLGCLIGYGIYVVLRTFNMHCLKNSPTT